MKNFKDEFYKYAEMMKQDKPFALARYADGECAVMKGKSVANTTDKWQAPNELTQLGIDLKETLSHTEDNYHYGISCQCCDTISKDYLLGMIKQKEDNITYSNLFVNANYHRWIEFIKTLDRHVILIANAEGAGKPLPILKVDQYFAIPNNCIDFYAKHKDDFIVKLVEGFKDIHGQLVLISAGPLAEIIVHHLYNTNPTNTYIDVGSAVAEIIHGRSTRPYMCDPSSEYYRKECIL